MNVSEQAFDVYCNEVVRDAVENNKALEKKNDALEPLSHLLQTVKVSHRFDVLKEISLMEVDAAECDEEYLAYSIHDADKFPYEDIKSLAVCVSGITHTLVPWTHTGPKLTILQDTEAPSAELVLYFDHSKVTGILSDFEGTLDDVQKMIRTNRFTHQYMFLGTVDTRTGRPPQSPIGHDPSLDGAMFTLRKVQVVKRFVEPALLLSQNGSSPDSASLDQVKELETLSEANKNHGRLSDVASECKTLMYRNASLMEASTLVQTVQVRFPGGVPINFKLEVGHKQIYPRGPHPFWHIEPLADQNCKIPLTSISRMEITLAGNHTLNDAAHFSSRAGPFFMNEPIMYVSLSESVNAFFGYDDSIIGPDVDALGGNFLEYIRSTILRTANRHPGHTVNGLLDPLDPEPEWTMRLLCLEIPLYLVQTHLDLLGVDTKSNDDDDES